MARCFAEWGHEPLTGIRDLARHLDISIGTVSRALNDKGDVNPLTRVRVREAAAKLGYSPNQSGRSLRRGRTDLVGVIVPAGSDSVRVPCDRQNEQAQERICVSAGAVVSDTRSRRLPQWQPPESSLLMRRAAPAWRAHVPTGGEFWA